MSDDASSDCTPRSDNTNNESNYTSIIEESTSEFLPHQDPYFTYKYRSKHHPFPPSVAPYPLCYDRFSLDTACLNTIDVTRQDGAYSLLEATDTVPARTLDVGCGQYFPTESNLRGYALTKDSRQWMLSPPPPLPPSPFPSDWVLSLAQRWPKTRFVGFDLCPIQPDPFLLDPALASRITWKHGNFLESWPFEDKSFDYIFIRNVSNGIPEAKWDHFFQEASRVLAKGGKLEYMDEDIIFPRLPIKEVEEEPPSPPHPPPAYRPQTPTFSRLRYLQIRGFNLSPISLIPHYLSFYFRLTSAPPRVAIPLPEEYPHPVRKKGKSKSADTAKVNESTDHAQPCPTANIPPALNPSPAATPEKAPNVPNPCPLPQPGEVYIVEPQEINTGSGIVTSPSHPIELGNKALAIHLLISVNRVLACKEAMWEVLAAENHWEPSEYRAGEAVQARVNFDRAMDVFQEFDASDGILGIISCQSSTSEALANVFVEEEAEEDEEWNPRPPSPPSTPSKSYTTRPSESPITPPPSYSSPPKPHTQKRRDSDAVWSYINGISAASGSPYSSPRVSSELASSDTDHKPLQSSSNPSLILNSNSTWWEDYPNVSRLLRMFFGVKGAPADQPVDTNPATLSARLGRRPRQETL
ncbi:hypothetical protein BS47DRAFT_1387361 [Hydnum rufescens UP504]|uniref:Methyltransferase domain-containing protein n=1 Tax=Hydnum rufescens UP504 TaxID=1448309 RepID=A0A9P6B9N8_9AGAM|nr:hypothetical protein BS47DRAFT_1387361 [Hydnum rufescens UP504]